MKIKLNSINFVFLVVIIILLIGYIRPNREQHNLIVALQDSLKSYKQEVVSQKALLKEVANISQKLANDLKGLNVKVNAVSNLVVQLDSLVGSAEADTVNDEYAELDTIDLWVRYYFGPRLFKYTIKGHQIAIDQIEVGNQVIIFVKDLTTNKVLKNFKFSKKVAKPTSRVEWAVGFLWNPAISGQVFYKRVGIGVVAGIHPLAGRIGIFYRGSF